MLASIETKKNNFKVVPILLIYMILLIYNCSLINAQSSLSTDRNQQQGDDYLNQIFNSRDGINVAPVQHKWLDVPYATLSPAEKLDIYLPNEGKGPFPIIVAIHGGSFIKGDKRDFQIVPMMEALNRGYAVVSINYRLSGEAKFPSQINDVKAAIRWIRANAEKYTLNSEKIAVWGDSAGGNLAALIGTSGNVKELEDLSMGNPTQSSRVDAVVDWYGPINFLTLGDQLQRNMQNDRRSNSSYIGKTRDEAPELYMAASPETYIRPDNPPFFIQHGNADKIIPLRQSIDFAVKLENVLGKNKVFFQIIDGANHLDDKFTTPENINKVLDFLDRYLK